MANETKEKISDSLQSSLQLKITIPLSEETKKLHVREFVKTKLSLPTLKKLSKLDTKYDPDALNKYAENVWHISKIDVKVSNSKEEMQLTLTPYTDSIQQEVQDLASFTETKSSSNNNSNNNSGSGSTINDNELKGDKFLKDIVKKAIGSKKDIKSQANACFEYFKKNHVYNYYYDFKRGGKNFKKTWNTRGLNCGDGAFAIGEMLHCLGLKPEMRLGFKRAPSGESGNHDWIVVEIDGKRYYCDQSGGEGSHNTRVFSTSSGNKSVWGGDGNGGRIVQTWK